MSRAICILGMHRSGTSVVTRLVNLLGAYLGEEESLMRPNEDNPSGYWERQDIYDFHERVLEALSQRWDTSFLPPPGWHTSRSMQPFRDELRRLVETAFGDRKLWAWKDPRTCLLLPLWKSVLTELGVDLRAILVLRNPLEVANSLEKRDGLSRGESFGIWFNYNLAMLEETQGLPRSLVSYDSVIANWRPSLHRCVKELGLQWPKLSVPVRRTLEDTVRHDLRHSVSNPRDLEEEHRPLPVLELFKLINRVARKGKFPQNFDEKSFQELLSSHRAYSDLHRDAFLRRGRTQVEQQERQAQLPEMRNQLDARDVRLQDLERLAESYQTRLREANSWFEQVERTRQELIAETRHRLDLSERRVSEKSTELAEARCELQVKNDALLEKENALQQMAERLKKKDRERDLEGQHLQRTAEAQLQQSHEEVQQKAERIRVLEELVREREKVNEAILSAATTQNQALETIVTQILARRPWRMTEPLRRAMTTLKEVRAKLRAQRSQVRSRGAASETKS